MCAVSFAWLLALSETRQYPKKRNFHANDFFLTSADCCVTLSLEALAESVLAVALGIFTSAICKVSFLYSLSPMNAEAINIVFALVSGIASTT